MHKHMASQYTCRVKFCNNVISILSRIDMKKNNIKTTPQTARNAHEHATITHLSCHVQSCNLLDKIDLLISAKWISIEFEFRWKKVNEMGLRASLNLVNEMVSMKDLNLVHQNSILSNTIDICGTKFKFSNNMDAPHGTRDIYHITVRQGLTSSCKWKETLNIPVTVTLSSETYLQTENYAAQAIFWFLAMLVFTSPRATSAFTDRYDPKLTLPITRSSSHCPLLHVDVRIHNLKH